MRIVDRFFVMVKLKLDFTDIVFHTTQASDTSRCLFAAPWLTPYLMDRQMVSSFAINCHAKFRL